MQEFGALDLLIVDEVGVQLRHRKRQPHHHGNCAPKNYRVHFQFGRGPG